MHQGTNETWILETLSHPSIQETIATKGGQVGMTLLPAIANQTQKRDVGVRTMTTTITNTAHAPNETKMRPPPMVDPRDTASQSPNQTRLPQIEIVETLNHA